MVKDGNFGIPLVVKLAVYVDFHLLSGSHPTERDKSRQQRIWKAFTSGSRIELNQEDAVGRQRSLDFYSLFAREPDSEETDQAEPDIATQWWLCFSVTSDGGRIYFVAHNGRPYGLAVRTPPFHGGSPGSIPVRVATSLRGTADGSEEPDFDERREEVAFIYIAARERPCLVRSRLCAKRYQLERIQAGVFR